MKGANIGMETEVKHKRKVTKADIEMYQYNKAFDSSDMVTIKQLYDMLEKQDVVTVEYNVFFAYLRQMEVIVPTLLYGHITNGVGEEYKDVIRTKICKDTTLGVYYYIFLLDDNGVSFMVNLMKEMGVVISQ